MNNNKAMNNKLNFLLRKNKGKSLLNSYKEIFLLSGFTEEELKYVDLEKSDVIINQIRQVFPKIKEQVEILPGSASYTDSRLLDLVFSYVNDDKKCYIFSDDVFYCGMFIVKNIRAKEYCLNVAKFGYINTCFLVDIDFNFSFTINYYNRDESELNDKFNIQLRASFNFN